MRSSALSAPGLADEVDGLRVKITSLQAFIRGIIAALSRIEHSHNHRFAADCLIYFRRALAHLDRFDFENEAELIELAAFIKEIERVASTCLVLIQQGNLIRTIDRVSERSSEPAGKANYC